MLRINIDRLPENVSQALEQVSSNNEHCVIYRDGLPIAAMIPVVDWEALREYEDAIDVQAAQEAAREPGFISWESLQ